MNCKILLLGFIFATLFGCDGAKSNSKNKTKDDTLRVVWRHEYQIANVGPLTPPEVVETDGKELVVFAGGGQLQALDMSGNEVWATKLDPVRELDCLDLIPSGSSIFGSHQDKAVSWNLRNGQKQWEFKPPSKKEFYSLGFYGLGPENFFGSGRGAHIYVIDRHSGELVREWQYNHGAASMTYEKGAVYLGQKWVPEGAEGQSQGGIMKIDTKNGKPLWKFRTNRGGVFRMRPFVESGRVYAGTAQGEHTVFFALDTETGEVIWRNTNIRVYWAIWAETPDGPRIFVNNGRNLLALNPEDGSILWRTDMNAGHGEAGLAYLDGYVYHPHGQGLRVVNAETGEVVHVEWPENGYFWEVGVGAGKVFAQDSGALYAFEPYVPE